MKLKTRKNSIFHTLVASITENRKKENRYELLLLSIFLIAVFAVYAYISISLHNKFMTFGLDLGYFDEVIWKISQFQFPYSGVGCIWMLEDHFQPILYLLSPLYWVWNNVRVILLFQSFIMIFAAFPLFLLSRLITKNNFFSFCVVFAYLFFIGTQFAILNEFHQVTIAPLFIAIVYFSIQSKKRFLYIFSIIGLLVIKEDLSLLVASIGMGLLFYSGLRRWGVITLVTGIAMFVILIYFLMPALSIKGIYSHLDFGSMGMGPIGIIQSTIQNPIKTILSFVTPVIKLQTIFKSLVTFALIPLLSPIYILLPLLQDFIARFIYAGPQVTKWGLVNHHAATSSMLLAIASIYGAKRLYGILRLNMSTRKFYSLIGIILILTTVIIDVVNHGPIHSIFKPQFYRKEQWEKDVSEVLAHVPEHSSVAAQNNLLPHLTHRESIYRIPYGSNSEYMVVDLHDGPNKYAPLSYTEMSEFVADLIESKRYSIYFQKGDAMVLKRNYKTDITLSKYYNDARYCYYSFEEQ